MADLCFDCSECESTFRKLKHLKYHKETVHSTERSYKCDQCDNSYKRSSHLRRHIQNSHSTLELRCTWDDCDKVFRGQEQLRKHLKRHETKGGFPCVLCGRAFGKKRQLDTHIEKTHGPFHCIICGDKYTSRCEYRLHMSSQHPDEATAIDEVVCPYCDDKSKTFSTQKILRNHIREAHVTFPCSKCGTSFSRERDLRNHHRLKHTILGTVQFGCEICGVQFASNSNLKVHQRTVHMGKRNHECTICAESFAYKHVLHRHMRAIHSIGTSSESSDDEDIDASPSPVFEPTPAFPQIRTWTITAPVEDHFPQNCAS